MTHALIKSNVNMKEGISINSHLIVDADTKSSIDIVLAKKPLHTNQHQMKVIHCRALNNPVHAACHELVKKRTMYFSSSCAQDEITLVFCYG